MTPQTILFTAGSAVAAALLFGGTAKAAGVGPRPMPSPGPGLKPNPNAPLPYGPTSTPAVNSGIPFVPGQDFPGDQSSAILGPGGGVSVPAASSASAPDATQDVFGAGGGQAETGDNTFDASGAYQGTLLGPAGGASAPASGSDPIGDDALFSNAGGSSDTSTASDDNTGAGVSLPAAVSGLVGYTVGGPLGLLLGLGAAFAGYEVLKNSTMAYNPVMSPHELTPVTPAQSAALNNAIASAANAPSASGASSASSDGTSAPMPIASVMSSDMTSTPDTTISSDDSVDGASTTAAAVSGAVGCYVGYTIGGPIGAAVGAVLGHVVSPVVHHALGGSPHTNATAGAPLPYRSGRVNPTAGHGPKHPALHHNYKHHGPTPPRNQVSANVRGGHVGGAPTGLVWSHHAQGWTHAYPGHLRGLPPPPGQPVY
jgi:hypothetical protein